MTVSECVIAQRRAERAFHVQISDPTSPSPHRRADQPTLVIAPEADQFCASAPRGHTPTQTMTLIKFPQPRLKQAYVFSRWTDFHYAERFAVAAVEYCCYSVVRHVGVPVYKLKVMDCSTSTGETPAGRHPNGSHNGGVNLDLGYYGLVDLTKYGGVPGPYDKNRNRMTGPPEAKKFAV